MLIYLALFVIFTKIVLNINMIMKQSPSPNFDERDLPVSLLLLHYTGMQTGAAALERLTSAEAKVSAHYLVEEDGRIFQMVEESKRAWHGGVGFWRGISNINSASIGIEIVNKGHEWGYEPFPQAQMAAVTALCQAILTRHNILPCDVIGHSDIAPIRKEDPGELFDWKGLAAQGIGLWPQPTQQRATISQLADYGYALEDETKTIIAFQRHFRPGNLSGQWDDECAQILASLLEQA